MRSIYLESQSTQEFLVVFGPRQKNDTGPQEYTTLVLLQLPKPVPDGPLLESVGRPNISQDEGSMGNPPSHELSITEIGLRTRSR